MRRYMETYEFMEDIVFNDEVIYEKGERITDPVMIWINEDDDNLGCIASGPPDLNKPTYVQLKTSRAVLLNGLSAITFPLESWQLVSAVIDYGNR